MSTSALIIDAVRTSWSRGTPGRSLSEVHPVDLLTQVLQGLLARHPSVGPSEVDDVIAGCVSQSGEQSATPGRMAWLGAGETSRLDGAIRMAPRRALVHV